MVGFTYLLSRSYYYICVDEVPAPRSRPTTVRQRPLCQAGERGAIKEVWRARDAAVLPSPTAGRTACMTSVNVTDSLTRLPALTSSSPPRAVPFILWSSPSYSPSCSVHHRCRRCRLRCRRHFRRRPRYRRPHGLAHCVAASCLLYATFRPLRQPIRCPTVTVAVAIVVTAASIAILVSVAVSMCGPSSYMESTSVLTVIPGGRGTGRRSPELLLATPAPEPHECSEVRSLGGMELRVSVSLSAPRGGRGPLSSCPCRGSKSAISRPAASVPRSTCSARAWFSAWRASSSYASGVPTAGSGWYAAR